MLKTETHFRTDKNQLTSSHATIVGPFHSGNGVFAFIASSSNSCLIHSDIMPFSDKQTTDHNGTMSQTKTNINRFIKSNKKAYDTDQVSLLHMTNKCIKTETNRKVNKQGNPTDKSRVSEVSPRDRQAVAEQIKIKF